MLHVQPVHLRGSEIFVEELEGASQKLQEIGNFIQQEEWMAIRIRAGEILVICKLALTRWPDHFSEARKNEIMSASTLVGSIAMEAADVTNQDLAPVKRRMTDAQLRASGHISSALGEARRIEERDGDRDGNGKG